MNHIQRTAKRTNKPEVPTTTTIIRGAAEEYYAAESPDSLDEVEFGSVGYVTLKFSSATWKR